MPKFGTKDALFGYFWARISKKTVVIFEISTLKFVISESLTHTVNFGIGSAFSGGPGPALRPLDKVCHLTVCCLSNIVYMAKYTRHSSLQLN